ncbi:TonB-dependent receptor [Glaciecola sp. MH2013]|uniref:TonB-dependent receptor domain-containing protein n=1 Tax=Glaciecola sp. MH2013 TaxID=2785524 RepID=UPI00189F5E0B|nr:TonB-dependent receptor [Glaciecola sp. MH2013]MBF7072403.1 TonB-dependent receptor [Glaciecola sp. MH2013]
MNQSNDTKLHKVSMAVLVALGCLAAPNLYAQEIDDLLEEEEDEIEVVERISVTGSRIKRAEFSNASPVQIISGDISRELGLFDTNDMLQNTSQASGVQIDSTFNGFVLDNGPGAATVGFRGLGADRTLVLVNGRRVAPAGVGGAPTAPDLNLIPSVLIDRIENLFDGASTVYGSDAIAGVANVILKKNVDGFEFNASGSAPPEGGEQTAFSLLYGSSGDNYSFTIAGEYNNRERQTLGESRFNSSCEELIYEGNDGNIYRGRRGDGPSATPISNCQIFPLTNRMSIPFFGSVYRTEGFTNIGIPNWSESTLNPANVAFFQSQGVNAIEVDTNGDGILDGAIFDGNGDGLLDFDFGDPLYSFLNSDYRNSQDFVSPLERITMYLNGDYLFNDENDTRLFYEGLYATRDSSTFAGTGQIFPLIDATNPYNPCGSDPINGSDCRAGVGAPYGPQAVRPILNIRGDRQNNSVDAYQYRLVGGVSGNIGALDNFGEGSWSYEVSAIYSASRGESSQVGISSTNFEKSIAATRNANGEIVCGDPGDDCVAVNLFSSNIYQEGGGTFTPEEAAYLFTTRNIVTEVKQTMLTGFITGDWFTLPWNDEVVPLVVGAEFRKDEIITDANPAAVDGLYNSFADQGADGSKNLREIFFETEFAMLRGQEWAEELTLTASGRLTEETFYAPEKTFSLKALWRPTEYLTIRGTRGTSYRTPNLRERFLNGTSGFNSVTDPCVVPEAARVSDPLDVNSAETYDASEDERNERVFASCLTNGIDATSFGLNTPDSAGFSNFVSAEVTTGGSETLLAERSVSETYGIIFEQPFTDAFDLTLSATWYDIEIRGAVSEPTSGFIIASCYNNEEVPDGTSGFCDSIQRDPTTLQMTGVDRSFINIGFEGSKGIDFNVFYQQDFIVGENELGVTIDLLATKLQSRELEFFDIFDDNVGEITNPQWRGSAQLRLEYTDFRFNWSSRFIGRGQNDNLFDFEPDNQPCTGLDVSCRPLEKTKDYIIHTVSASYGQDNWAVTAGIRNLFDRAPPLIDGDAGGFQQRNVPLGVGYDIFGRTVFASVAYSF